MKRIRFYPGHVALGLIAGVGSAAVWFYALRDTVPLWAIALLAVLFVLAAEVAMAEASRRRTTRRPRRRAHARPHPTNPRKANL